MTDKAMACPFDLEHTVCVEGVPRSWNHLNLDDVHCRAWTPGIEGCRNGNNCPDADTGPCMTDKCPNIKRDIIKNGYCRLIPHE